MMMLQKSRQQRCYYYWLLLMLIGVLSTLLIILFQQHDDSKYISSINHQITFRQVTKTTNSDMGIPNVHPGEGQHLEMSDETYLQQELMAEEYDERQQNYEYEPSEYTSSAIVYLINTKSMQHLKKSLLLLHSNFLRRFPTDVILFYDVEDFTANQLEELESFTMSECTSSAVFLEPLLEADWALPHNFDPRIDKQLVWPERLGYKQMIRFWYRNVFYNRVLEKYEYYMRLDTDSNIHSEIMVNPFQYMKQHGYKYAYRYIREESKKVVVNLFDFLNEFKQQHADLTSNADKNEWNAQVSPFLNSANRTLLRKHQRPKQYYNNFEIVDLKRWRNLDFIALAEGVDASKGIFAYRWGDAPLRYYSVQMFLDVKNEVWHFCNFTYEHEHHHLTLPSC